MRRLGRTVVSVGLFLRFEYLVFAFLLPILGAASVRRSLDGLHVLWLLVSAFCLHVFISLQNDIVDLKLDRTDPRRRNHPLVKGTVRLAFASLLALVQLPLVVALIAWRGFGGPLVFSAALVVGMLSVYNLWGKRNGFPPGTDLAQGIGFAGLAWFGAAGSGTPNELSRMVFWAVVLWMMQTNLLGGLRDLQTDSLFGVRTTPIFLGSYIAPEGYRLSAKSRLYAYAVLCLQFAIPALFLWKQGTRMVPAGLAATAAVILLAFVGAAAGLAKLFTIASHEFRLEFDLALVAMYLSALPMLTILAQDGDPWVLAAASVVLVAALRTYLRYRKLLP
jgi:4-hydroxybenzoate polyprenyltransferase